jgi:hypothetical protein
VVNQHAGVNWDVGHVHGHGCCRLNQMSAIFFGGEKSKRSVPMSATAFQMRRVVSPLPVTLTNPPRLSGVGPAIGLKREHAGVFLVAPGKSFMDWTMAAQAQMGQRSHFPVGYIVIILSLWHMSSES